MIQVIQKVGKVVLLQTIIGTAVLHLIRVTVSGTNTNITGTAEDDGPIAGAKTWRFEKSGTSNQWNGWESTYGGIWTGSSGDIWTTKLLV